MNAAPRSPQVRPTSRGSLVYADERMHELVSVLDRVAGSSCTVLVTGESGTGKELVVAALHDASPRRDGPLVAVNCGAIPDHLVESELFGHTRGAFTGAASARAGHVASAAGGTLFLDEIGELPLAAQVKLLRLLQQREYTPVGETRAVKSDARIVAATNRDLAKEVALGRFREDLYYRLDVIQVVVPSLASRRGDIPLLARAFLERLAAQAGRPDVVGFTAEAMEALVAEPWPGNVRELENVIERAVLLTPGPLVDVETLTLRAHDARQSGVRLAAAPAARVDEGPGAAPTPFQAPATQMPAHLAPSGDAAAAVPHDLDGIVDLRAAVEAYENQLIGEALRRTGNNKSRAAQLLGLQRSTFVEMLKRKGIDAVRRAA